MTLRYDRENNRVTRDGVMPTSGYWSGGQMFELCPQVGYEQAKTMLPQVVHVDYNEKTYRVIPG